MEMIGIALVVVLLVIGMAFVFKALIKPAPKAHEKFAKEQEAQNLLLGIGRSVSTCRGLDMTELMQDCANYVDNAQVLVGVVSCVVTNGVETCTNTPPSSLWPGVKCYEPTGEVNSCIYVNDSIKYIFSKTLEKRNLPYRFFVYKADYKNPILYMDFSPGRAARCNEENIKPPRGKNPVYDVENPGELTLPLSMGGTVSVKLDICTTPTKG